MPSNAYLIDFRFLANFEQIFLSYNIAWVQTLPYYIMYIICKTQNKRIKKLVKMLEVILFSNLNLLDSNYHKQTVLAGSGAGNTKNQDLGVGFNIKAFLRYSEKLWAAEIWIYLLKFWRCDILVSITNYNSYWSLKG